MSEQADRDALGEALAAHPPVIDLNDPPATLVGCACGWRLREGETHRDHVADALLLALAQRDRRVAAEVLREAAEDWEGGPTGDAPIPRWWLRERADRVERGE